jgi:hypothetical protein
LLALGRLDRFEEMKAAALEWQLFDPENPMVYELLGTACSRLGDQATALRALSSIAEVSPGDSGLLNRAGYLALRAGATAMAEGLFRFALARRPDHANNHRGLALAQWMGGRHEEAARTLTAALRRSFHGRYGNVTRILREELGLMLGAMAKASGDRARIDQMAKESGADPSYAVDLRVTLHWDTDANDVDLHVVDPEGEECFYSHKRNGSGLNLYEDLTRGLGPETAVVPVGRSRPGAYHVGVKYFNPGPMGALRDVPPLGDRPRGRGPAHPGFLGAPTPNSGSLSVGLVEKVPSGWACADVKVGFAPVRPRFTGPWGGFQAATACSCITAW